MRWGRGPFSKQAGGGFFLRPVTEVVQSEPNSTLNQSWYITHPPFLRPMKLPLLTALCFCGSITLIHAQDTEKEEKEPRPDGWELGAGLGADLGQLLQFNPKVGQGENRIGLGANLTFYARLKRGLRHWDNNASFNFAVQKLGQGVLPPGFNDNERQPYQKSIDELRLASQYSREFGEGNPFGYGVEATFVTQLLPTYQDSAGRNLLKDIDGNNEARPIGRFLSPATFTLSPGITYRPSEHFDALLSPASYKTVFIKDADVAGVRGPDGRRLYDYVDPDGEGRRSLQQFGASLRVNFSNTFLPNERLLVKTTLGLFSNYLDRPKNVDLDWRTEIGLEIVGGLTVTLNTTLLYDDDVPVQISNYELVGGVERRADGSVRLGPRLSVTEQLLIKYAVVF